MSARPSLPCRLGAFGWAVALACLTWSSARAQERPDPLDPLGRPLLLHDINFWAATADTSPPASRTPRLRLPRMPVTSLGDPLGLSPEGDEPPPDPDAPLPPPESDLGRVQLSMGTDNPFFDFRRRGSPGGVGYYKVHTQLQLFDTGTTGCTLTCQAVRPAGLESNGVNEGPSFVSSALTVFHDLGDGAALHGFVGKDVRANSAWREGVREGNLQYGVALQQPLSVVATDPGKGLFFFVEAQGRWSDRDPAATRSWELVPGLHYRVSDSWWMSGGVLLPFGPTRDGSTGQWHLSCRWQY